MFPDPLSAQKSPNLSSEVEQTEGGLQGDQHSHHFPTRPELQAPQLLLPPLFVVTADTSALNLSFLWSHSLTVEEGCLRKDKRQEGARDRTSSYTLPQESGWGAQRTAPFHQTTK